MLAKRCPILAGVMRSWRWGLVGWSVALAAVPAIYASFWPAMGGGEVMQEFVRAMPESLVIALGFDAMATAAGYLEAAVFGMLGLALLLSFAISAGARLIAGEEETGILELELTHPVARRTVLVQRAAALAVSTALLVAVVGAVTMMREGAPCPPLLSQAAKSSSHYAWQDGASVPSRHKPAERTRQQRTARGRQRQLHNLIELGLQTLSMPVPALSFSL